MSATAVLFPGFNAIFRARDRRRHACVPEVKMQLRLLRNTPFGKDIDTDAVSLMQRRRYCSVAAITLAIQNGLYQHHCEHRGQPSLLAGCSLGDISRTVSCGVIGFEQALDTLIQLSPWLGGLKPFGMTVAIRLPHGRADARAAAALLHSRGIQASVLSSKHLNVGCSDDERELVYALCAEQAWDCQETEVHFPLHSRHMSALVDRYWEQLQLDTRVPTVPVFSSVQLVRLTSAAEILADGRRALCEPVRWLEALEVMREREGVEEFIDIGPCRSLTLLARESDRSLAVRPIAA